MQMQMRMNPVVLVCWVTVATTCLAGEFIPGHVYIAVEETEACDFGGQEWIIEIDPETGESTIFADSSDDLCSVSGLRFTPDGMKLRAMNGGHLNPFDLGWVLEFDGDGTGIRILDADDGLEQPFGYNGLAFDAAENFYLVNTIHSEILRFPADGGKATVFADFNDGLLGRGALDFAPNGDLYYAGDLAKTIVRITPDGEGSVFDVTPDDPITLVVDDSGNVFVATDGSNEYQIYRYDDGDAASRSLLAAGFTVWDSNPCALSIAPHQELLYLAVFDYPAAGGGRLFGIDPVDGSYESLAEFDALDGLTFGGVPTGMAVYEAPLPEICEGDANGDGTVDLLDSGFVLSRFGCEVGAGDDDCDVADQNDDGFVDPLDLGFVLARFGECR